MEFRYHRYIRLVGPLGSLALAYLAGSYVHQVLAIPALFLGVLATNLLHHNQRCPNCGTRLYGAGEYFSVHSLFPWTDYGVKQCGRCGFQLK